MYAKINNKVRTENQATVYPRPLKMTNKRYSIIHVVVQRETTVPAFSIHLLLPQTGAVSAAENVRKDQQKMYVLSEYYSILH